MKNETMVVFNDRYLRELPLDQLESLIDFLYEHVSAGMEATQLRKIMIAIKKSRRPGVVIETDCGKEHHIIPSQKVSKIRLNGTVIYEVHGLQGSANNE